MEGFRTGGIHEMRDSGLEGFRTRGIHERGETGQEGCGTGEILGRRDRKGGIQDRRDAEQEKCYT